MDIAKHGQVLVVGAGPVGLAAALELARLKYQVRIIEKKTETSPYSKAMGINARTLELLEPSHVTKDLLDKGLRIPRANFFNRDRLLFRIDISKLKHRYNFMLSLPQSETERTIEKRLNEFGIELERGVELINFEQSEEIVVCVLLDNGIEKTLNAN